MNSLRSLLHYLRASCVLIGITLNTLIMIWPLYLMVLLKLLIKADGFQRWASSVLVGIAEAWISTNNGLIWLFSRIRWRISGLDQVSPKQWYFVTSNHQSWSDILALQYVFNRKAPFFKFFLKQELRKVPLLGDAWWALDFPFMKRYTRAEIEKNPALKGKDLETTREACRKFAYFPTAVMNFMEGTRFTPEKHRRSQSPYQHLLKPKSGGAAFTLGAMAGTLNQMLDVTLIYPEQAPRTLIAFLGGAVNEVIVDIKVRDIPDWTSQGDYENDPEFRIRFHRWVADLWKEKDALIAQHRGS